MPVWLRQNSAEEIFPSAASVYSVGSVGSSYKIGVDGGGTKTECILVAGSAKSSPGTWLQAATQA